MSKSAAAERGEQYEEPDWLTLTEDEDLLWKGRQSLWTYVSGFLTSVIVVVAGIALAILNPSLPSFLPAGALITGLAIVLIGIAIGIFIYPQYRFNLYAISSEQVYYRSGVLARDVTQVRMEQIQNTACNQGILERILSFGDVRLDTAGSAQVELHLWGVKSPQTVNQIVTTRLNEISSHGNTSTV